MVVKMILNIHPQQQQKKISKHIPSRFSMSTISSFRSIENKYDVYRGKDCMKKFCEFLREHVTKINDFKNKKK